MNTLPNRFKIKYFLYFLLCCSTLSYSQAASLPLVPEDRLKLTKVFQGDGVVWGFDFISSEELVVTLREGKMYYYHMGKNAKKELPVPSNITVQGQGGLLDVHYKVVGKEKYLYLTYSTTYNGQLTTALARGTVENGTVKSYETLFRAKVKGDSGRHFGSRLTFHNNHIFMTIGDRGERRYAQDLSYHNGTIIRLDLNGNLAKDNPFVKNPKALNEIWSYGHRNPQGIDIDPASGKIYSCEFGPRGGDELNLIQKGINYGWPIITYGSEYWGPKIGDTHHPKMEQPITHWTPSISPSGMAFYTGDKIPQWKNSLFLANLRSVHLRRLVLKNNKVIKQEVLFARKNERVRHVRTGKDGFLYFSTDSGKIFRVSLK